MRRTIGIVCIILAALVVSTSIHASIPRADPFSITWGKKRLTLRPGQRFEVTIAIDVPQGYYLTDDKLDVDFVSLEGLRLDDIRFPPPEERAGKEVHSNDVVITIAGHVPPTLDAGQRELTARLSYQGCTETQCFRPRQKEMAFLFSIGPQVERGEPATEGIRSLLKTPDFSRILGRGVLWTVLLVFLAGLITSLTPCVWPIIPVTLIVIGVERQRNVLRNVLLAASLVSGLIFIYAVFGTVAASIGRNLGFIFQQRWFVILVVIFFVVMSLSLFGIFEVHLSKRWAHRLHRLGGKGFRGAFLSGLGLGLIASPCAGPVVVALLAYVALQGSYAIGFVLLIVYGLGMGTLIVILGAAYGVVAHRVRGGPWMLWMKRGLGIILLVPAAFYLGSLFDGRVAKIPALARPTIAWVDNLNDGLRFAERSGRPVMIDFYADWCPPCRRLDRSVFTRNDVVNLSYQMVPVRIDATSETAEIRTILDQFKVMGLPTFVFLSPTGKEYVDLRVVAPQGKRIVESMKQAIQNTARGGEE